VVRGACRRRRALRVRPRCRLATPDLLSDTWLGVSPGSEQAPAEVGENEAVALFLAAWPPRVLAATLLPEELVARSAPGSDRSALGDPGPDEPPNPSTPARADRPFAALRIVPEVDRHATLVYLGPVSVAPALALLDLLEERVRGGGTDAVGLAPVDVVVGAETVVLGAGALVVPLVGLDRLAGVLRRAADASGVVVPDGSSQRAFVGHVTVARAGRATARRGRAGPLHAAAGLVVPGAGTPWRVTEVVLASSDPVPSDAERSSGGRYGVLRRVGLG
jgi:2'-5' RNA ligase